MPFFWTFKTAILVIYTHCSSNLMWLGRSTNHGFCLHGRALCRCSETKSHVVRGEGADAPLVRYLQHTFSMTCRLSMYIDRDEPKVLCFDNPLGKNEGENVRFGQGQVNIDVGRTQVVYHWYVTYCHTYLCTISSNYRLHTRA